MIETRGDEVGDVIGFVIGLTAGGMMGALVMALMVAAGDYDRREEEELRERYGRSDKQKSGD